MAQKTNRRYYAMHCPYGIRSLSEGDVAYSFPSKAERDAWVEAEIYDVDPTRCAETLKNIKRRKLPIIRHEKTDW